MPTKTKFQQNRKKSVNNFLYLIFLLGSETAMTELFGDNERKCYINVTCVFVFIIIYELIMTENMVQTTFCSGFDKNVLKSVSC